MPPSPAKLKEKLLKAIDEEHNVSRICLGAKTTNICKKIKSRTSMKQNVSFTGYADSNIYKHSNNKKHVI